VRALLDTHALLWWWTDDQRLSRRARRVIADVSNDLFVSSASAWEVATKARLGKLDGVPGVAEHFAELALADGFIQLPVNHSHALAAGSFRVAHRGPFDRMLAAQCRLEAARLITRDPAFRAFELEIVW
jgi:PIN domain nuclease of toxin-antitoxin system